MISIGEVLDAAALAEIRNLLTGAAFVSGAETAGWAARGVKNTLQLAHQSAPLKQIGEIVAARLLANEAFYAAAIPRALSPVMVSRSEPGMGYGTHMDDAVMGEQRLRTDLAFTVFLSDEADYDGGELVIDEPRGDTAIKMPAGGAILYPATSLHRVTPVTRGARLVAIGWVQSLVRDPRVREILFDLQRVRQTIFGDGRNRDIFDLVSKAHSNLLRMFAEP